jgi:hypothetical protein
MARISFSSSSSVKMSGSGQAAETKFEAVISVPHQLKPEQIREIREAFRKAGIDFECREIQPGTFSFGFSVSAREGQ